MSLLFQVAHPKDMPAISVFADRLFRSNRPGQHMAEEFPHLYAASNASHWFIAQDRGVIIGAIGSLIWPAMIAGFSTVAAGIGSVATDPHYRRQGVATRLLRLAEHTLKKEGVRLMLISGDLPVYRHFGARPIGRVQWHVLPSSISAASPIYHVRPIDTACDIPAIARLYQTRSTRWIRRIDEWRMMLKTQPVTQVECGTKIAQIVCRNNTPVSYLIVNHRPFHGRAASRLSEWAGDPSGVLYALTHLPDLPAGGLHIPVLPEDLALSRALQSPPTHHWEPFAWLSKVIDGVGLMQDLTAPGQDPYNPPLAIEAHTKDASYQISRNGQIWTLNASDLTRWLFAADVPERPSFLQNIWPLPALWPEGLNYV
ncbi:MAG: GNAT family N-acetyltransferase [Firmicutes bacterium]|nr:GNAT family N-acetyltransferase [Bacillota bacterium]